MNVEIGTVAAQFPEKEFLFQIFGIGFLQCVVRTCIVYRCERWGTAYSVYMTV